MSQVHWAEDDLHVPAGVYYLGLEDVPLDHHSYVMYHGTTRRNAQLIQATGFRPSKGGMLGRGVYLSRDLEKASCYPVNHPEYDRVVIKVVVNVGKVMHIDRQHHPYQKSWHERGYDTAWVPPHCGMVRSGREEACVWDPNRIQILKVIQPRQAQSHSGAWGYD